DALDGLLLLTPAACGGLPDSGPAGAGVPVDEAAVEPLQAAPQGPRPGAEPDEVVGGFLRAGAGFDNDHAVAREFLAGSVDRSWRPEQATVVYADDTSLTVQRRPGSQPDGSVRVEVRAPVSAVIDDQGAYVQARPGQRAVASFDLQRRDGQWRVSRLDAGFGLWLPRYEVDRAYSPVRLSYVAAGTRVLVPDLRWFGGPRAGLATLMVRQLLTGPPAWLRSALVSGAPRGTRLSVDAVPVTDGVAQVDLTAEVLTASPQQRQQLWAQLVSTLGQLPGVVDVRLTSGGTPVSVPGVEPGVSASTTLGFLDDVRVTGEPLALVGDRFERVDTGSGQLTPGGTASSLPSAAGLAQVGAGPGAAPLVGLSEDGTRLLRLRGQERDRLVSGASLLPPSVDAEGVVWTADQTRPGGVVVTSGVAGDGRVDRLSPAWLAGRVVRAIDLSRAGDRIAVVSSAPDGSRRLDVAGIVRTPDRRPVRLTDALQQGRSLTDVRDVAWADRSDLVVLAKAPGGVLRPFQVAVGGLTTAMPLVTSPRAVAAGDGMRAVYVVDGAGQLLTRSGSGWRVLGQARSVTVPT
ncbi:LpqB family beta-propeller domain-containing protein, partial [Angustibacter aerolatus]